MGWQSYGSPMECLGMITLFAPHHDFLHPLVGAHGGDLGSTPLKFERPVSHSSKVCPSHAVNMTAIQCMVC